MNRWAKLWQPVARLTFIECTKCTPSALVFNMKLHKQDKPGCVEYLIWNACFQLKTYSLALNELATFAPNFAAPADAQSSGSTTHSLCFFCGGLGLMRWGNLNYLNSRLFK